jgi:uncharacterized protein YbaP (TraB family)
MFRVTRSIIVTTAPGKSLGKTTRAFTAQKNQITHLDSTKRFFKISDHKGRECYLVGSCHSTDPFFAKAVSSEPLKLLNCVESVYCEVDLIDKTGDNDTKRSENNKTTQETISIKVDYSDGFPILIVNDKNLSLRETAGFLFKLIRGEIMPLRESTYVIFVISMHFLNKLNETHGLSMDEILYHEAKKQNKLVGGLENNTRSRMFEEYTDEEVETALMAFACAYSVAIISAPLHKFDKLLFPFSGLEELYLHGMLDIAEEEDKTKEMFTRNQYMFKKMEQIIPREKALFVVGYGHLHGQHGLLKMFRDKSYRVTYRQDKIKITTSETLQRQIKPAVVGATFLALSFGLMSDGHSLLAGMSLLMSGRTAVGIYNRTNFLFSKNSFWASEPQDATIEGSKLSLKAPKL